MFVVYLYTVAASSPPTQIAHQRHPGSSPFVLATNMLRNSRKVVCPLTVLTAPLLDSEALIYLLTRQNKTVSQLLWTMHLKPQSYELKWVETVSRTLVTI